MPYLLKLSDVCDVDRRSHGALAYNSQTFAKMRHFVFSAHAGMPNAVYIAKTGI